MTANLLWSRLQGRFRSRPGETIDNLINLHESWFHHMRTYFAVGFAVGLSVGFAVGFRVGALEPDATNTAAITSTNWSNNEYFILIIQNVKTTKISLL
jgi:hypothetical protein